MSNVIPIPIKFKPRLIQEGRTPAEDLEYALKQAWDRQASKLLHPKLWDDPPER